MGCKLVIAICMASSYDCFASIIKKKNSKMMTFTCGMNSQVQNTLLPYTERQYVQWLRRLEL